MRPSPRLLKAASGAGKKGLFSSAPVEVYPLFVAMGFVCVFAGYHLGKKFTSGDLRVTRQGKQPDRVHEHQVSIGKASGDHH